MALHPNTVIGGSVDRVDTMGHKGEVRFKIEAIYGKEDGLGVECLSGSASIASIYEKAFETGFSLTYVTARTVGIGAYLARLGRR